MWSQELSASCSLAFSLTLLTHLLSFTSIFSLLAAFGITEKAIYNLQASVLNIIKPAITRFWRQHHSIHLFSIL